MPTPIYKNGYDYISAEAFGITPDASGHWPSLAPLNDESLRNLGLPPGSSLVLKDMKSHPTAHLTRKTERELGNKIIKKGARYFSVPADWTPPPKFEGVESLKARTQALSKEIISEPVPEYTSQQRGQYGMAGLLSLGEKLVSGVKSFDKYMKDLIAAPSEDLKRRMNFRAQTRGRIHSAKGKRLKEERELQKRFREKFGTGITDVKIVGDENERKLR